MLVTSQVESASCLAKVRPDSLDTIRVVVSFSHSRAAMSQADTTSTPVHNWCVNSSGSAR
jgi:hypothetical protein